VATQVVDSLGEDLRVREDYGLLLVEGERDGEEEFLQASVERGV
jgi:hypothetical protein